VLERLDAEPEVFDADEEQDDDPDIIKSTGTALPI